MSVNIRLKNPDYRIFRTICIE